jgi:Secretion system C-terminal sorting domain
MVHIRFCIPILLLLPLCCFGQQSGSDIFLHGAHLEAGTNFLGCFGTYSSAPAGYHANIHKFSGGLGFVADPDTDGWDAGTPSYFGDYMLPGVPLEGWSIQENGIYLPNVSYNQDSFPTGITGNTVSYTDVAGVMTAVWQGTAYTNLAIKQTTTLDTNDLYLRVTVQITNTASSTAHNVYYMRFLDPDNEYAETGNMTTINKVEYQLPNAQDRVLVSATGTTYPGRSYLGLGTAGYNAKCFIYNHNIYTWDHLDSLYDQNVSDITLFQQDTTFTADVSIGLLFSVGDIPVGASQTVQFYYVFRADHLDKAFGNHQPQILIDNAPTKGYDTLSICDSTNEIPVSVANDSGYKWSWSPATGLASISGATNTINPSVIIAPTTFTITGTSSSEALSNYQFYLTLGTCGWRESVTPISADSVYVSPPYPNPANGYTTIDYSLPANGRGHIRVYDLAAQTILEQSVTGQNKHLQLNTSNWARGIYYFTISGEGRAPITKKLIVQQSTRPIAGTNVHLQLGKPGPKGWPTNEAIVRLTVKSHGFPL